MRLLKMLLVMLVCAAGPAGARPGEEGVTAYGKSDLFLEVDHVREAKVEGRFL